MKRAKVRIDDVADWHNLVTATYLAARGKRVRPEVRRFTDDLESNIARLGQDIRSGTVEVGKARCFRIRDPKPRQIHAPCFRERVLHHALMRLVGPVLERSLVDDTFACRSGKGTIAAVQRAQHHMRRFPWFAKLDVRKYFASIDHRVLITLLSRKFADERLLELIDRIVDAHHDRPGVGLPIGALTSQCFANFYLGKLDRFLLEASTCLGLVRYMDDVAIWGASEKSLANMVAAATAFAADELRLEVKPVLQLNRRAHGITLCGYRVFAGTIRLAQSRKKRFRRRLAQWEQAWLCGDIDSDQLQRGYASVHAITLHADAQRWRGQVIAQRAPSWYDDV